MCAEKCAEALRQRLNDPPNIGQHLIEYRELGFFAGTGMPACAINDSNPAVLSATVLPPVLGPADQQRARFLIQLQRGRHHAFALRSRMSSSSG